MAWIVMTIVDIYATEFSFPAIWAKASERIYFIYASSTVPTRIPKAVVDIFMAVFPNKTLSTGTCEISAWLTNAPSMRATNIRGDVSDTFLGGISGNLYCTAVYYFTGAVLAVIFQARTILSIIVIGTCTVIIIL